MGIVFTEYQEFEISKMIERGDEYRILVNKYPYEAHRKLIIDTCLLDGLDKIGFEWLKEISMPKLEMLTRNGKRLLVCVTGEGEFDYYQLMLYVGWLQKVWRVKQTCEGAYI